MVGPEGQLWLDDYPYAQDGLDLWGALLEYFTAYLRLYYSSNDDVVADTELQAWWSECKVRAAAAGADANICNVKRSFVGCRPERSGPRMLLLNCAVLGFGDVSAAGKGPR
jgi:hypothetical protein